MSGSQHAGSAGAKKFKILVYSSNRQIREAVLAALGRKPAPELPQVEYLEVATEPAVIREMDSGEIDLVILDGEAQPAGGLGIARQLKDEIYNCPPVVVLVGRPQDAWLATWSRAEEVVPHPLDPMVLAEATSRLLRSRVVTSA